MIQVYLGYVLNNIDPMNMRRISCRIPALNKDISEWIPPTAHRGFYSVPSIGDQVLIVTEDGDVQYKEYIGISYKETLEPKLYPPTTWTIDDCGIAKNDLNYIKINDTQLTQAVGASNTILDTASYTVTTTDIDLIASAKCHLKATLVDLGASATQQVVLGNILETLLNIWVSIFNAHTHSGVMSGSANTGGPSASMVPLAGTELSSSVNVQV